mmetsp:Transcript_7174/g.19999  ORF Transcript_7174/g.19999 Transcript_7174/m.19999 type:complete len:263 (+) Transcript_7174:106-894(+)
MSLFICRFRTRRKEGRRTKNEVEGLVGMFRFQVGRIRPPCSGILQLLVHLGDVAVVGLLDLVGLFDDGIGSGEEDFGGQLVARSAGRLIARAARRRCEISSARCQLAGGRRRRCGGEQGQGLAGVPGIACIHGTTDGLVIIGGSGGGGGFFFKHTPVDLLIKVNVPRVSCSGRRIRRQCRLGEIAATGCCGLRPERCLVQRRLDEASIGGTGAGRVDFLLHCGGGLGLSLLLVVWAVRFVVKVHNGPRGRPVNYWKVPVDLR